MPESGAGWSVQSPKRRELARDKKRWLAPLADMAFLGHWWQDLPHGQEALSNGAR